MNDNKIKLILTFIMVFIIWSLITFCFLFIIFIDKVEAQPINQYSLYYNDGTNSTKQYELVQNVESINYLGTSGQINEVNLYYNKTMNSGSTVYFSSKYRAAMVADIYFVETRIWYANTSGNWRGIQDNCTKTNNFDKGKVNGINGTIITSTLSCKFTATENIAKIIVRYDYFKFDYGRPNITFYTLNQEYNTLDNSGNMANDINANNDKNAADIIENQNQNTEHTIDAINNINQVCTTYNFHNETFPPDVENAFLNGNGGQSLSNNWFISDYIPLTINYNYTFSVSYTTGAYYCLYNINKDLTSCYAYNSNSTTIIGSETNKYIRVSYQKNTSRSTDFTGEYCYNSSEKINFTVDDINSSITSDDAPTDYSFFSDIGLSSETPITNLLLIPITLLSAFNNGVSGSCQSVNLGSLYGTDLILPCINLEQRLGSNLWSTIDKITSLFLIYEIAMLIISAFESITSLNDDFDSLYTPKHGAYKPKHSSDYERIE